MNLIQWTYYCPVTGEIHGAGALPEGEQPRHAVAGVWSGVTHYVDLATLQPTPFPDRPPGAAEWSWSSLSWVQDLDRTRAQAKREIDRAAEDARLRYITPGAGQAQEYDAVYQEALMYVAAHPGPFPMLQADVAAGIVEDVDSAAGLVIATRKAWEQVGAVIRATRLAAKRQVDLAQTVDGVLAIQDQAIRDLSAA